MKLIVLCISFVFATKLNMESVDGISGQNNVSADNPILVKIEEDEYVKQKKFSSKYLGVNYNEGKEKWQAYRWSKKDNKKVNNGTYKDEETAAHASDTLARKLMANGEQNHKMNFPYDETEVHAEQKQTSSKFIGVFYIQKEEKWQTHRWGKNEKKEIYNGSYKDEATAAYASDTLARKLMANGEQNHKLNFPDDDTEVHAEKQTNTSKYIGVSYSKEAERWHVQRRSKGEKKMVHNGYYDEEETAAHASDTLARKFMTNGEQNHKLNFPYDSTEVYPEKEKKNTSSKYRGVTYDDNTARWQAQRWSKNEKTMVHNGHYKEEETAAHASDTLARKLIANGEQNHTLNFPDDDTEVYAERKFTSKYIGLYYNERISMWQAQRWSKNEKKLFYNGAYKDEETGAHASDNLARKLMANGEQNHKINFSDNKTEIHPKNRRKNKRKRSEDIGVSQTEQNFKK